MGRCLDLDEQLHGHSKVFPWDLVGPAVYSGCPGERDLLDHPASGEPGTLHEEEKRLPLGGILLLLRHGVEILELHNLLDEGDGPGGVIVVFAQPDAGLCGTVVDASHHLHLVVPLLVVFLVDTQCVDPQNPVFIPVPEIFDCQAEFPGHGQAEIFPAVLCLSAPAPGQSLVFDLTFTVVTDDALPVLVIFDLE